MIMKEIIVFTDGSSTVYKDKKNNKYGGIGVYFDKYPNYNVSEGMKGPEVTNQRAELTACIRGIKTSKKIMKDQGYPEEWKVTIYSDSLYSINCATKWGRKWIQHGWKRKTGNKFNEICNLDLIKKLYQLTCMYDVTYVHVRGHQKQPDKKDEIKWFRWNGNNEADRLASGAMNAKKNE